jgi:leucyl-tRNA synthetase
MQRYNPKDIEPKWQKIWDETGVYTTDLDSSKPKYLAMSMFNYPSGAGIHIGHAMNYTISDVKARFKRQQGFESYHPVGWDAFGLPGENYAIKTGVSPQESMANIIPGYHKQYKAMGWSNDWEKEIATHLPEYYKWTQWIFVKMFEQGLAYQDSRMQWWCEADNTVLANEQIVDGKCWRHDGPDDPLVEKKEVKQWFFKITEYADELLEATDALDWTESVKLAQKNWIGKSQGAEIDFKLDGSDEKITVFTTRPDTLFGATFLVLAPEHELVTQITTSEHATAVNDYVKVAQLKSEVERQANKGKTGVFTGAYATNPINNEIIPIWIADYVLTGYGTGAIMAVPAHDERDHEFAVKFNIPILEVVAELILGTGKNATRPEAETLVRPVADAIIVNKQGEYLLEVEDDNIHFVGGGIDPEDGDDIAGLKREIIEEVGYTDVASITPLGSIIASKGFRIPKGKNQNTTGMFFEVILASDAQVPSEIEDGKHSIKWVKKEDVAQQLTWTHHQRAWTKYLTSDVNIYTGNGVLINSGQFDWMSSEEAKLAIVEKLAEQGMANKKTNFKMRDWSVSRQRYWGAPIPIIDCPACGPVAVPEVQLPVILPELDDFQPSGDGRSALARATDWLKVDCPKCGGPAERETDTLDTYICSSWYMYRFLDPHNQQQIFDSQTVNKWMPVDFYNGGDHATAHLLYARFVARFFTKLGIASNPEPFKQMLFNGKVTANDGTMFSKSKGNGVDPLDIIAQGYGADALRTYLMFAAPLELWAKWDPNGVPGTHRFLSRIWTLVQEYQAAEPGETPEAQRKVILRVTHQAIKKMTEDIESNAYNTAIAAGMTLVNDLYKLKVDGLAKNDTWQAALEAIVACVGPFAPHISEELWHQLGHSGSVHRDSWPSFDEQYLAQDSITIVVQVNGKLRGEISVAADAVETAIVDAAKADAKVTAYLNGVIIRKTVYVPGRLVNFVVTS